MKKILFLGAMAAMLLSITSCSNDMEPTINGDEAIVQYTVKLGDAVDSRTISDGTGANILKFAVFTSEGEHLQGLDQEIPVENKMATVQTKLAMNRSYKIVFWAQNSACTAYNTEDMSAIKVNYDEVNCNDETRDAFYKMEEVSVSSTRDLNRLIVLTRPFAQINFVATDAESVADFADYNYSVTVPAVPTTLNTLDGTVGGETVDLVTFLEKPAIEETLENYTSYKWLAMNYILAGNEKELKETVTLTVNDNGSVRDIEITNVPVQRNYRTNIFGDFHSKNANFYVQIHPMFDGDLLNPNAIPADEVAAAVTVPGATVVVEAGSELSLNLSTIAEGVTLDLNGSTIKYSGTSTNLRTINKNNVTIKNGFISNDEISSGSGYALYVSTKNATISNIDFVGDTRNLSGEIQINGNGTADDIILIEDCNFTTENDSYKAFIIYGTSTVRLNRCAIDGIYPFNCDGAKCDMIVDNSTLTGWTSWNNNYDGQGHTMTFNNCKFGTGHRNYAIVRPYNISYFNNCIFEAGVQIIPCKGNGECTSILTNCTILDFDTFMFGPDHDDDGIGCLIIIDDEGWAYNPETGKWEPATIGSGGSMTEDPDDE